MWWQHAQPFPSLLLHSNPQPLACDMKYLSLHWLDEPNTACSIQVSYQERPPLLFRSKVAIRYRLYVSASDIGAM